MKRYFVEIAVENGQGERVTRRFYFDEIPNINFSTYINKMGETDDLDTNWLIQNPKTKAGERVIPQ